MGKFGTTSSSFIVACVAAAGVAIVVEQMKHPGNAVASSAVAATRDGEPKATVAGPWAASAPGRVEPISGEIRVVTQIPGRIAEVLVGVNDQVKAGDLLFRLEDDDHRARVEGADAEVSVRVRERDQENVGKTSRDRRTAEDNLDRAQRTLFASRIDLDRVMANRRAGRANDNDVAQAREAVVTARQQVERERDALQRVLTTSGVPLPTRLEAGLAVARAELSVAETALSRTRVRAPIDGTILQVNARVGEMAGPNPELASVIVGDVSRLKVRAEIVERDIDKVRVGQGAVVTSDAFPGRQFEGRVTQVGRSLSTPIVSQKGPRRPNDVDVLEVLVELTGQTPLLPGMRTDVFFKPEGAAAGTASGEGQTARGAEARSPAAGEKR
jgi:HlyD family secretion protein